jgi:hypothetical protein
LNIIFGDVDYKRFGFHEARWADDTKSMRRLKMATSILFDGSALMEINAPRAQWIMLLKRDTLMLSSTKIRVVLFFYQK